MPSSNRALIVLITRSITDGTISLETGKEEIA
jgi:hypothetical protein